MLRDSWSFTTSPLTAARSGRTNKQTGPSLRHMFRRAAHFFFSLAVAQSETTNTPAIDAEGQQFRFPVASSTARLPQLSVEFCRQPDATLGKKEHPTIGRAHRKRAVRLRCAALGSRARARAFPAMREERTDGGRGRK